MKLYRNNAHKQRTDARIATLYPDASEAAAVVDTRDMYIFQRDINPTLLRQNGFVAGYLGSVEEEYPSLDLHLKDVVQAGKRGVEAIFSKIESSKRKYLVQNSSTRFMARIGTLENPEGIPLEKKFASLPPFLIKPVNPFF